MTGGVAEYPKITKEKYTKIALFVTLSEPKNLRMRENGENCSLRGQMLHPKNTIDRKPGCTVNNLRSSKWITKPFSKGYVCICNDRGWMHMT